MQEHCPPEKNHSPFATHHLLSTTHHSLPFYQSPLAAVSRLTDLPISRFADKFGSAGASPSHFIPSLVPRPTTRSVSVPCPLSHVPPHNFTCQTLMVSSLLAEARKLPDGEKANAKAQLRPPSRVKTNCQSLVRQTRNRSSMLPETAICPSGRKATALTSR